MLRVLCIAILWASAAATASARDDLNFDQNWLFTLGDPEGAEQPKYDAAAWRLLDVPDDWAFEANYDRDAAQGDRGGYKPGGIGWYRKTFELPDGWD